MIGHAEFAAAILGAFWRPVTVVVDAVEHEINGVYVKQTDNDTYGGGQFAGVSEYLDILANVADDLGFLAIEQNGADALKDYEIVIDMRSYRVVNPPFTDNGITRLTLRAGL